MQPQEEFENHEVSPEVLGVQEAFSVLGRFATAQILISNPEIRARVRASSTRGFLPLALGMSVGGLLGDHFIGGVGWILGIGIGLFAGLCVNGPR